MDLYSATVTSVPFLLLAVLGVELPIFGPAQGDSARGRRLSGAGDLLAIVLLAAAFAAGVVALALGIDTSVTRQLAGYGLGLGGLMVFTLALARVLRLYRSPAEASNPPSPDPSSGHSPAAP
jgi:hypothetical protein